MVTVVHRKMQPSQGCIFSFAKLLNFDRKKVPKLQLASLICSSRR